MLPTTLFAAFALAAWAYLLLGRGGFWLLREHEDRGDLASPATWPSIVAVIPARDEAEMLPLTLPSLIGQDYPGSFGIIVVDDHSADGTGDAARAAAARGGATERVQVLAAAALPPGWTGKLWAMEQGFGAAASSAPDYVLFTDADILYKHGALRRLAARAFARNLVLVSVMAKLNAESQAERLLIPAFVFFFRMLYPFAWVNKPRARTAAAAGGCMLVERKALLQAGGLKSIRSALIDDCALGARMKQQGPVWLGLSDAIRSLRPYPRLADIRSMVVRSAYSQLRYSPILLLLCFCSMTLVFLAPPLLTLLAGGPVAALGLTAWLLMALSFAPMLRFYGLSPLRGMALPAIAALYLLFTMQSAVEHGLGRGGMWKGRAQAITGE